MGWYFMGGIIYLSVLVLVLIRILFATNNTSKSLAYILLCLFVPVFGILFYITFGINYWNKKRYSKKLTGNTRFLEAIKNNVPVYNESAIIADDDAVEQNAELSSMLLRDLGSPLTANNRVWILTNGENKFPELLKCIKEAKHHIHLEYYIYECDETGLSIIELLIEKARQGVKVRFIYDDFGSPGINRKLEKRMIEAGIEIQAFYKIKFYLLANRFNYRNHRKIIIIDGCMAFVGGINVSDKYVNGSKNNQLYWRDTHIKLEGPAVYYLQYLFIADWNYCATASPIEPDSTYFGKYTSSKDGAFVQIAASGPDSPLPSILYSTLQAINLAREEILITTPYFIPGDSLLDALCVAALSGLKVKLMVPGISDSKFVNAASRSYFNRLLDAGVEIYLYKKGFVHAKTMVTDGKLSVIGTANMDHRSFELNFEVNAIVYDEEIGKQMRQIFLDDILDAEKINKDSWINRPWHQQLPEKIARLFSPVL